MNEKLGIDPCQMTDYLTLVGDASATTSRARSGIGPKTAKELLNTYGNLEDVYRALDAVGDADAGTVKPSQRESLKELRPRLDAQSGRWCGCAPTCRWTWGRCSYLACRR